jgi:putative membrane protein
MLKSIAMGTVVLGLAAAPAFAQGQPPTTGQTGATGQTTTSRAGGSKSDMKASSADHTFIMKAAQGGMAEVELGQLAATKASSEQVKQFGQRMVTDHQKANDELKTLAQQKNITVPTDLDAKDKTEKDRLSKLSGEAFDKAYMQHMLADHRKDVNEFRKESTSGKDPDVKAWAGKTLPTLEEHLKMAQDANKAVGTSGTKSSTPKGTKGSK